MVEKTKYVKKIQVKDPFEAGAKVALVIVSPGDPNDKDKYLPLVANDGDVMSAWLIQHGFDTKTLVDSEATPDEIDDWLFDQTVACNNLRKTKPKEKFLLFCFYSGHGDKNGGTNRIHLNDKNKTRFPLEDKIRLFSNSNEKNAFVVGFLH